MESGLFCNGELVEEICLNFYFFYFYFYFFFGFFLAVEKLIEEEEEIKEK